MRYVVARFKLEKRQEAYRIYVTDCFFAMSGTLHALAGGGPKMTQRYADIISPPEAPPKDERTQEEIVSAVWRSIRGENK